MQKTGIQRLFIKILFVKLRQKKKGYSVLIGQKSMIIGHPACASILLIGHFMAVTH